MIKLDLPDELALAFAEEPVLDLYSVGPWRIPDGLFDSLRDRAERAVEDERVAGWTAQGSEAYRQPNNGVAETLDLMLGFLIGGCAVRSGYWGDMVWGFTDRFLARAPGPRAPSWNYLRTQDGAWRPPGWLLPGTAGTDPDRRATALAVLRSLVDVFAGIDPIEPRRAALARLIDQRADDPAATGFDVTAPFDTLPEDWGTRADPETLAALPELGGTVGYLAWALDGLSAVHEHLLAVVGDGDGFSLAVAQLLAAAGLKQVPTELAVGIGSAQLQEIEGSHRRLLQGFAPDTWRDQTARWLVRATIRGELAACRAWLDMAMRVTGAANGLPGRAMLPGGTVWVPVSTFEWNIRALLSSRSLANPLAGRFKKAADAQPVETENRDAAQVEVQIVGQPELATARPLRCRNRYDCSYPDLPAPGREWR